MLVLNGRTGLNLSHVHSWLNNDDGSVQVFFAGSEFVRLEGDDAEAFRLWQALNREVTKINCRRNGAKP